MQALDEGPVGPRVWRRPQRCGGKRQHADDAGHLEAPVTRLEARQHLDPAHRHRGGVERDSLEVFFSDRAVAVAQQAGDAAFGRRQGLGLLATAQGQRLQHLDRRRRPAVDAARAELGHAARRQVAGAATAEAAQRQPDAHVALGHPAAQAVAEAQRAGLGVQFVGRRLARDLRVGTDGRQVIDPEPGLVTAAG